MSIRPCEICLSCDLHHWTVKDAKSGQPLDIRECQQCGFVQLNEALNHDDLKSYYTHEYRNDYKKVYRPKAKHVFRAGRAACQRLKELTKHLTRKSACDLLDVGAGGGEFVYLANKLGFNARGIEPSSGYSDYAREQYAIEIQTAMLQDLAANSTDIITMFHVLEHMASLDSVIQQLWQTLRPSGILFIEVPNILQSDASPNNIFFKAHINYFSIYTLAALTSIYFDLIAADDNGNLKMVLARRQLPLENKKLPSAADMKIIGQRMTSKGWIEYLTKGGGFTKPFKKVANVFYEQTLPIDATVILDNLYSEHLEN